MEKAKYESETKSQLVTEICNLSKYATPSSSCPHRRPPPPPPPPPPPLFIDWYLLLRVNEDAEIDIIRRRYLKLALLLHPDKNDHPKAEYAFKLVSQAYICLSDKDKRKAFDLERLKSSCTECSNPSDATAFNSWSQTQTASKGVFSSEKSKIMQRMKDLRIRLGQEANVIEKCLRVNATSRKSFSTASKTELPVFNPADYNLRGYPHMGSTTHKKATQDCYLRTNSKKILTS